jgi:predicted dehydrogenase
MVNDKHEQARRRNIASKLRVAVIGVGFFALNPLRASRDIDAVEIAAICDTRPERLAEIAA